MSICWKRQFLTSHSHILLHSHDNFIPITSLFFPFDSLLSLNSNSFWHTKSYYMYDCDWLNFSATISPVMFCFSVLYLLKYYPVISNGIQLFTNVSVINTWQHIISYHTTTSSILPTHLITFTVIIS